MRSVCERRARRWLGRKDSNLQPSDPERRLAQARSSWREPPRPPAATPTTSRRARFFLRWGATVGRTATIVKSTKGISPLSGRTSVGTIHRDWTVGGRSALSDTAVRSRATLGRPVFHRVGHYLPPPLPAVEGQGDRAGQSRR